MTIAIFGLGYVGSVSAACLASVGHDVIGVDVDEHKLSMIRQGRSPINEPGLDELLGRMVQEGRLTVTSDTRAAVLAADVSLLCVGTPSRRNGSLESIYLEKVMQEIGAALAGRTEYHVVAVRSTLLPGVLVSRLIPILEEAQRPDGGHEPRRLRQPRVPARGQRDQGLREAAVHRRSARATRRRATCCSACTPTCRRRCTACAPDEASMVKYASNNFHALKVAFANEIGAICQKLQIDGQQVMRVFCEDQRAEHLAALPAARASASAARACRRICARSSTWPRIAT